MNKVLRPLQAAGKQKSSIAPRQKNVMADNRPEATEMKALQRMINESAHTLEQQKQVMQGFGHPNTEVVQRMVDYSTLKRWKQSAGKSRDKQRKPTFDTITDLIESLVSRPYDSYFRDKLKAKLNVLLADPHYSKYSHAIESVLTDMSDEDPLSEAEIETEVNNNLDTLLPLGEGDLALPEVRELRRRILIRRLAEDKYSKNRMEGSVQGMAQRGVIKGQWVGRGLCQEATLARGGGAREIKPRNNGSGITWNHYIIDKGNGWLDPTWKQFFGQEATNGISPVFEGDADDFRKLGLPKGATDEYLLYLGKAGNSNKNV